MITNQQLDVALDAYRTQYIDPDPVVQRAAMRAALEAAQREEDDFISEGDIAT